MHRELHEKAFVSSKGQIVIPKSFRNKFNIHMGTELLFETHKEYFIVKPVKRDIRDFFGSCKIMGKPTDVDAAIMQAVSDNDRT